MMAKLTQADLRKLGDGTHADGNGLYLRRRGGSSIWIFRYQVAKRRRDISIGSLDTVSLRQARDVAIDMKRNLTRGESPRGALAPKPTARTLGMACEDFIQWKTGEWRSSTEEKHTRNQLHHHYGHLYDQPVGHIGEDDILDPLRKVWEQPSVAEKLLSRIRQVFRRERALKHIERPPMEWDLVRYKLPKVTRDVKHHPAVDWREANAFWRRLDGNTMIATNCLRMIILTACRSGEVRGMRWDEIDMERARWTIPASRVKTRKDHIVPLSGQAMDLLRSLYVVHDELVFPGRTGRPITDMAVLKVQRKLDPVATVHGWRSAFRDWGAETERDPNLLEISLAHNVGTQVERAYRRSNLVSLRARVMQAWADHVTGEAAAENVVRITG